MHLSETVSFATTSEVNMNDKWYGDISVKQPKRRGSLRYPDENAMGFPTTGEISPHGIRVLNVLTEVE